jgi:serine/threonine-protein kinase
VEAEGPQSAARTVHVLRQITAALCEAHEAGLVHRDVKPENVMLCTRGGVKDFVKVLDFGLVKDVTDDTTHLTSASAIAGTPLYLAPEAILAPDTLGPPADVYAVGCVAHFLLTAQPPFPGENLVEVCAAHVHAVARPPSRLTPVPRGLDELILACLEKDPTRRPTASALAIRLELLGAALGASE